ncbi:MAG: hypothetical protein LJF04_19520 [Gemmatimonadetes bacterium]|nr:hypothetical protein [Gemmatimonadota bacterium]
MRRLRANAPAALLATILLGSPLSLGAQRMPMRGGGPPGQQSRQQLEERVRARFGQMIEQRLGLDQETAQALNATVQSFQEERGRLTREQQALRKRVEAFTLEGGGSNADAQQLLDRMNELRSQENQLYRSEQDSLANVLTPSQLLRFNVLREQMAQRIQQLRMGGMMGRGRGPGGGSPDGVLGGPGRP